MLHHEYLVHYHKQKRRNKESKHKHSIFESKKATNKPTELLKEVGVDLAPQETIEEKIDLLLEEQRDLADKIVASTGESWISNLDDEKLKQMLLLSN